MLTRNRNCVVCRTYCSLKWLEMVPYDRSHTTVYHSLQQ